MKRFIALFILLSIFLAVVPAAAESRVYVKDNVLKVYSSANTSARLLGRMGFGTSFTLLATSGSWARIKNGSGAVGYCKVASLSATNPNTDMRNVYVAAESAKMYALPESDAAVVNTFSQNESFTLLGVTSDNKWCRVKKNGQTGYMKKSELSLTKTEETASYTVYVSSLYLSAYISPNASSRLLGKLPLGTPLTLLSADGEWAYVRNAAGTKGYSRIGEITAVNPAQNAQVMYALRPDVKAYAGPDTKEKVVSTYSKNESCRIEIRKDGWGAVASGKGYRYVRLEDFGENAAETAQTVYVSAYMMRAYDKPSSSGKYLGSLPFGTQLTQISRSGDWLCVENDKGTKGYCRASEVSWTNPNGEAKKYYAQRDGVCVYQTPSTDAKKMKTYKKNAEINVIAETADGKWLRVLMDSGYGYASWSDFSSNEIVLTKRVYIKSYSGKAFARADENSKCLGVLPFGTEFECLSETGVWTMVKNSAGNTGYMRAEDLTDKNPNSLSETLYAAQNGIQIYASVSEKAGVVRTLSLNDSVNVIARTEDGLWLRIALTNGFGYAKAEAFKTEITEKETKVYVASTILKAYESPDENTRLLGSVGYATQLTALGEKLPDGWAKVRYDENGRIAYVKTSGLITKDNNIHNKDYYAQTTTKAYALPDTSSAVSIVFGMNEKIKVTAVLPKNTWARVESGKVFAYVQTANLGTSKVPEGNAGYTDKYRGTASAKIEKVIALAVQQFGKPYIYATEGPDSYDCSGLTLYCFKLGAGINLHRSAQKQGYDTRYAKIENTESLKRGDIICMNTVSDSDLSDHVGIYLGGGQFIHASSGGEKVMVSSITTGYYKRVFSWALRVLP